MRQPHDAETALATKGYEVLKLPELKQALHTTGEGLAADEASARLSRFGPNALAEEHVNPVMKFLSYFWGPIPWMIEIAVLLSAWVRHWTELIIISILLVMNAIVGFWEEFQAGNTIAALKAKLALQARVRRGGRWLQVAARELVPGDRIRLRLGDIVPADARLLEGDPVEVDQSALTGESLPVTRKTGEAVYSGAVLRQGEADALVYATGRSTYFGRTAHLVQTTRKESHFQRAVLRIGDFLILTALVMVALILIVALFRGDDFATTLLFCLVLTVAAIPVAMPAVLSVTMAVGAKLLAAKQAIVTRLASIEELAGIDVLCSDKTGTLTQNKLTLNEPYAVAPHTPEEVIRAAALASRGEDNDPIDLAVLGGIKDRNVLAAYSVRHFTPFDPVHKRTEAEVHGPDGKSFHVTKGAPQVILDLVGLPAEERTAVDAAIGEFAGRGFRALGVARTDADGQWRLLGVLPLSDPPREDSKATVETARHLGVKVKMVTGDQVPIAREIARQLGMGQNILDASLFGDTKHHETAHMQERIEQADGFAQVFPEHKYHIVDVLENLGHITGMTGDGVNDAPALKKAHVGIAVSGATDAARAASDIVLTSSGLSVIIDAVRESRKIFQRMNSYAIYRIAETIRVLLFMTLSILVFDFYPVTAAMIVLLALLNDGPILAIAFDRAESSNRPEAWNMPVVLGVASVLGILGVLASFGLFFLGERVFHLGRDVIQSFIFLKLAVAGHLTIFLTRTRGPFWSKAPAPLLLWSAIGTKILATLAAVYGVLMAPIGWEYAGLLWAYALVWWLVNDRIKLWAYQLFDRTQSGWLSRDRNPPASVADRV